jgi:hypothetical protein
MIYNLGRYTLGRNVSHDPRSRNFAFDGSNITLKSTRWHRNVPCFDQGHLGSCTGNSAVGLISTDPYFSTLPAGTKLDESIAVSVYSDAEKIDGGVGYPPEDQGSSGISVAKVLLQRNLISGYRHCFSLNDALAALTQHPIMIGVNWYNNMFNPDANGLLTIAPGDSVAGGHEFILDEIDVERKLVGMQNSWGTSWGVDNGRAYMSFDTLNRLLSEQGDATVLVGLNNPAPQPSPTPVPPTPTPDPTPVPPTPTPVPPTPPAPNSNSDIDLWNCVKVWASSPRYGKSRVVAKAILDWGKSKGFTL